MHSLNQTHTFHWNFECIALSRTDQAKSRPQISSPFYPQPLPSAFCSHKRSLTPIVLLSVVAGGDWIAVQTVSFDHNWNLEIVRIEKAANRVVIVESCGCSIGRGAGSRREMDEASAAAARDERGITAGAVCSLQKRKESLECHCHNEHRKYSADREFEKTDTVPCETCSLGTGELLLLVPSLSISTDSRGPAMMKAGSRRPAAAFVAPRGR